MKAASAVKSKPTTRITGSIQRNRNEIARRAAAVSRHWSARERNERASVAKQLQSLLFVSLAITIRKSHAVA